MAPDTNAQSNRKGDERRLVMKFLDGEFSLTESEYQEFESDMIGLCCACGGTRDCCEPDARNYKCPECEEKEVFGVPELMLMGLIELYEEDEEDE